MQLIGRSYAAFNVFASIYSTKSSQLRCFLKSYSDDLFVVIFVKNEFQTTIK